MKIPHVHEGIQNFVQISYVMFQRIFIIIVRFLKKMQQGCHCRYNIFIYTYLPINLHCTNVKYFQCFIAKKPTAESCILFCALYCFSVLCDDVPKCRLSYDSLGIFSLAYPENKARILPEVSLSPSP
jgi:hypothetical protein